jgi:hypothetical protein
MKNIGKDKKTTKTVFKHIRRLFILGPRTFGLSIEALENATCFLIVLQDVRYDFIYSTAWKTVPDYKPIMRFGI